MEKKKLVCDFYCIDKLVWYYSGNGKKKLDIFLIKILISLDLFLEFSHLNSLVFVIKLDKIMNFLLYSYIDRYEMGYVSII